MAADGGAAAVGNTVAHHVLHHRLIAGWIAEARSDVARHPVEAATLEALAVADVVRCGDALCARVEAGAHAPAGFRRIATKADRR